MVVKFQVFKKSSPNSKITLYIGKRTYRDHVTHVEPIEGVLLLDPNYVQERHVYVQLALSFRFGREEDESMGYNFVRTMYLGTTQLYPPVADQPATEMQRNLISKLGNFTFPFTLSFPELASPSYVMMQGWEDQGALMGVEYEVMGFVGAHQQAMTPRSTCRLTVQRQVACPPRVFEEPAPSNTLTRSFLTCSGTVTLEAQLNSAAFFPEEDILVRVRVRNETSREARRLKAKVVQLSEVPMFHDSQVRQKTVAKLDVALDLPPGGATATRDLTLVAALPSRQASGQVFIQPRAREGDKEELAASTLLPASVAKKDLFGVYVAYVVRVKVIMGPLVGDAVLDVPFVLAVRHES